jgi:hypothetical protein
MWAFVCLVLYDDSIVIQLHNLTEGVTPLMKVLSERLQLSFSAGCALRNPELLSASF